jgi:alkanesulfonate monooxygenase SsuD/methylene tetrahydromethanopterin reductase-like flavin-dependent oxidoreductase (luciferase family)
VRIRQVRETVEVAKLLWTADDATYAGQHYRVDHAHLHPKPDPLPPIMIGGGGKRLTLRVVAEHADWWNGGGDHATYAHKLDVPRGHCAAAGRDYDAIQKTWQCECVAIAPTREEAERYAAASPFYAGRVQSVALRLVVERERASAAFVPVEYWTVDAALAKRPSDDPAGHFRARLVAIGKAQADPPNEECARAVVEAPAGAAYKVLVVRGKRTPSRPALHHQHPAAGGVAQSRLGGRSA